MTAIYDSDGNEITNIGLSDKQRALLEAGENVVMIYHTPQMLRHVLGIQQGSFVLTKQQARIVVNDADRLRVFAALQRAIAATREQR